MKHYWLCGDCAKKKGGVWPKGHVATSILGKCPYCKKEDESLVPYVDYNWPKDKKRDKISKLGRD